MIHIQQQRSVQMFQPHWFISGTSVFHCISSLSSVTAAFVQHCMTVARHIKQLQRKSTWKHQTINWKRWKRRKMCRVPQTRGMRERGISCEKKESRSESISCCQRCLMSSDRQQRIKHKGCCSLTLMKRFSIQAAAELKEKQVPSSWAQQRTEREAESCFQVYSRETCRHQLICFKPELSSSKNNRQRLRKGQMMAQRRKHTHEYAADWSFKTHTCTHTHTYAHSTTCWLIMFRLQLKLSFVVSPVLMCVNMAQNKRRHHKPKCQTGLN